MTATKRIKSKVNANAVSVESTALLGLVADIRTAVGDPTGKLMQDELVARCKHLRELEEWIENEGHRVKARRLKDGWIAEDAPEWNATLLIDP